MNSKFLLEKMIRKIIKEMTYKEDFFNKLKENILNINKNNHSDAEIKDLYIFLYQKFLQSDSSSGVFSSYKEWDLTKDENRQKRYNIVKKLQDLKPELFDIVKDFNNDISSSLSSYGKDIKMIDGQVWYQIDINNRPDVLSQTIDNNSKKLVRRHNLYCTIKSNDINLQTTRLSANKLYEYFLNFKQFIKDITEEFHSLNEIPKSKYFITKFKTINMSNQFGEKNNLFFKSDMILFNYISFLDNFKIYFSNVTTNNEDDKKEYSIFVEEVKKIVNDCLQKNNLIAIKRDRSEIGSDFESDLDSTHKSNKKASFGQVVAFYLTKYICKDESLQVREFIIKSIDEQKFDECKKYLVDLTKKIESYILNKDNKEKILKILSTNSFEL